jgi:hypothetical protein
MQQCGGGSTSTPARDARGRRALASIAIAVLALSACADDSSPAAGSETSAESDPATTSTSTSTSTTAPGDEQELGQVANPVALDAATDFGNGVGIELTAVDAVEVEARLPGEISGPGVAITIDITNDSAAELQLDNVTVDLVDAAGASASPVTPKGAQPLSGPLAVGASTTGTYLFTLPADDRADATLRVSYTSDAPTVLFTGDLPQ